MTSQEWLGETSVSPGALDSQFIWFQEKPFFFFFWYIWLHELRFYTCSTHEQNAGSWKSFCPINLKSWFCHLYNFTKYQSMTVQTNKAPSASCLFVQRSCASDPPLCPPSASWWLIALSITHRSVKALSVLCVSSFTRVWAAWEQRPPSCSSLYSRLLRPSMW